MAWATLGQICHAKRQNNNVSHTVTDIDKQSQPHLVWTIQPYQNIENCDGITKFPDQICPDNLNYRKPDSNE